MKSAVIIIDMQNGFIEENSPLCIKHAKETIPNISDVIKKAHSRNIPVIYVTRIYREDGSDVEKCRFDNWNKLKPLTLSAKGALSADMPSEFEVLDTDYKIIKPRFSAFFNTELDLILRRLNIKHLYLCGTTTPNCIRTTCYDALSLDYEVSIINDCTSSRTMEVQQANIIDMKYIGASIINHQEF